MNYEIKPDLEKILVKLKKAETTVADHLDRYEFHEAAQNIYQFIWHEFADIYIEKSKLQLKDEKLENSTKIILARTLYTSLILLHPFMPFVTEEIHQKLRPGSLLMIEKWPKS